jgi:hypothetical protein
MKYFTKEAACAMGRAAAVKAKSQMKKTAEDNSTFNETVPMIMPGSTREEVNNQGESQPKKQPFVQQAGQEDQYAAVPAADYQDNAPEFPPAPPEMIGAAHSFLGSEVLQAAMAGDPNAQDLVARTAAHIGSNMVNMNANASQQGAAGAQEMQPGMDQQQVDNMQPQAVTSPEEDLVNELVPNVQAAQAPAMGANGQEAAPGQQGVEEQMAQQESGQQQGGESDGEPGHIDVKTVAKLINLAKAGKI